MTIPAPRTKPISNRIHLVPHLGGRHIGEYLDVDQRWQRLLLAALPPLPLRALLALTTLALSFGGLSTKKERYRKERYRDYGNQSNKRKRMVPHASSSSWRRKYNTTSCLGVSVSAPNFCDNLRCYSCLFILILGRSCTQPGACKYEQVSHKDNEIGAT